MAVLKLGTVAALAIGVGTALAQRRVPAAGPCCEQAVAGASCR